jgi:hypothetical protein
VSFNAVNFNTMPKQPTSVPEIDPDRRPVPQKDPPGRTPYPVEDPGIDDLPGSEPDYIPPTPGNPPARF